MKKTLLLSVVASTMIMAGGVFSTFDTEVKKPDSTRSFGWEFFRQTGNLFKTNNMCGCTSIIISTFFLVLLGVQFIVVV